MSKFRPKFVLWIPADGLSTSLPYPFFKGRRLPRSGLNSPQSVRLVVVILNLDQNVRNGNVWQDAEVLGYLPYPPPAPHLPPFSKKVGLAFETLFKIGFFLPFFRIQKSVKILSMKKSIGSCF